MKEANIKISDNTDKLLALVDRYVIRSITDASGMIIDVSEAFCKISGYSKEELIGKQHSIVRHPDMPSEVFENLWKTIKQGNFFLVKLKT